MQRQIETEVAKANPSPPSGMYKFIISAGANLALHPIMYPSDTALTRLQNFTGKMVVPKQSLTAMIADTANQANKIIFAPALGETWASKLLSLYKGFGVAAGYKVVTYPLRYSGQPIAVEELKKLAGPELDKHLSEHASHVAINGIAGATLGALEVAVFFPWNTVQKKMQSGTSTYKNVWDMIKTEKMQLYRGGNVAIARNVPGSFAFFTTSSEVLRHYDLKDRNDATLAQRMMAGTAGGVVSTFVTNPVDVVKTRMQTQSIEHPESKLSGYSIFKQIMKEEGVPALWKGTTLSSIKSISKFALPFALSSYLPQVWDNYWGQGPRK